MAEKSISNTEYLQNNQKQFFDLVRQLGFDCRKDKGASTIYSKNSKSYYTLQPENSYHKNFKYSITKKHLESSKKNRKSTSVYQGKKEGKFIFKSLPEIVNLNNKYKILKYYNKDIYKLKKLEIIIPIMKHNNVAFREYDKTEIIAIDIDTHSFTENKLKNNSFKFEEFQKLSFNILNKLKELNLNVILYEDSKICRGIHAYIKLNNLQYKEKIKEYISEILTSEFKEIQVEYRNQNKSLRLPFAYDYNCRDIETFKIINKIYKKVNQSLNYYNKDCIDNEEIYNVLQQICAKPKPILTKSNIFYKENVSKNKNIKLENFQITSGNRVSGNKTQWKLLGNCLLKNKSVHEFITLSKNCNIDSKDLNKWNDKKINKNLTQMFEYGQKNFVKKEIKYKVSTNSTFVSSLNFISEKDEINLEKVIIKLKENIISNNQYNRQTERLLKDCNIFFLELIGKIKYEDSNSRKLSKEVIEDFRLTSQKRSDLLQGYQFPKEYLVKLKNHYNLKSDINTLFKIFKDLFLDLYIHKNGTTYIPILGSCKQYLTNDIFENYFREKNNLIEKKCTTKYYDYTKLIYDLKNEIKVNREQIGEG